MPYNILAMYAEELRPIMEEKFRQMPANEWDEMMQGLAAEVLDADARFMSAGSALTFAQHGSSAEDLKGMEDRQTLAREEWDKAKDAFRERYPPKVCLSVAWHLF